VEDWIIESETAINIHTGETKEIDTYNHIPNFRLDPDWKLVSELSRLEIIKLWQTDHGSSTNILY
jgi:hypothetical protein